MQIIITSGGTAEPIDSVRSIKNEATGRLGKIIAETMLRHDETCRIHYVHGQGALVPTDERIQSYPVVTTNDVAREMERLLKSEQIDYVVHAMAMSDYTVESVVSDLATVFETWNNSTQDQMTYHDFVRLFHEQQVPRTGKIASTYEDMFVQLQKTPKVIQCIKRWSPQTELIGFKLLSDVSTETLIDTAYAQLIQNQARLVVANDQREIDGEKHRAYIVDANKNSVCCETKQEIAAQLISLLQFGGNENEA